MDKLIAIILMGILVGCGNLKGEDGTDGKDGEDGKTGKTGEQGSVGATGRMGQRGADGAKGDRGLDGRDGRDGIDGVDAVLEVIDPCGDNPNEFDEVLLRTATCIAAYFRDGDEEFIACIPDGNYQTTDKQKCNFTIKDGEIL